MLALCVSDRKMARKDDPQVTTRSHEQRTGAARERMRSGIKVHYPAEQFENDGSPLSAIIKAITRSMAGEYSRELSVKVSLGQCRVAKVGNRAFRLVLNVDGYPAGVRRSPARAVLHASSSCANLP
jgi:hypothetical protein